MSSEDDDTSGYKRPPKHAQYKKGQSGNPAGRPKGSKSLGSVLRKTLRKRVVASSNGERRSMSIGEAAVMQVATQAASGNLRASSEVMKLWSKSDEEVKETGRPEEEKLTDADREVLAAILNRRKEANPGDDESNVD